MVKFMLLIMVIVVSVFQLDSGEFSHIIKDGPIRYPYYIAVSSKGQLLVTDNTLFCVLVFDVNSKYLTKVWQARC